MENFDFWFLYFHYYIKNTKPSPEIIIDNEQKIIENVIDQFNNNISLLLPNILTNISEKITDFSDIKKYSIYSVLFQALKLDKNDLTAKVNSEFTELNKKISENYEKSKNKLDSILLQFLNEKENLTYPFLRLKELLEEKK